jgi:hypothetical protein
MERSTVSEGVDFACGHAADLSGALILRIADFALV